MSAQRIHNFCIIAHIDHGKSTLADRLLEITGTVEKRNMREQLLDMMDLERERGITIKLQPVRMEYQGHILNLIDTPGHVDFQYEVSRSLQAVEGAILLVDAAQGVQAQTLANLYLALEQNLIIIPVVNKIDLPTAKIQATREELVTLLGVADEQILAISAKTGEGVKNVLDAVIERVSLATTHVEQPLRALIFDSLYDDYKGIVAYVRVMDGTVRAGDDIVFLGTGAEDRAVEVGVFTPEFRATGTLSSGEIGYIATGLKDIRQARVGDTISLARHRTTVHPLPGFIIPQPKVFAGIYPRRGEDLPLLRESLEKLKLNDASLTMQQEHSEALGQGFRCGFLGLLHLEIVQERLQREHKQSVIITTPGVLYRVTLTDTRLLDVTTPAAFPDPSRISMVEEQYVRSEIIVPSEYVGAVFELLASHEGTLVRQEYVGSRALLVFELPLRELVVDLYDRLKSVTSGYGSLSYELGMWHPTDVVKLLILVNQEPLEALSVIVPRARAERLGRRMVEKLQEVIPRQLFAIALQAAVGGKVVARETLPALRKNVTGHLYGGDVTRKRKLLDKQKKGKKRLAARGSVEIPPGAYIAVLKR